MEQTDFSHPKTPLQYLRLYLTGFAMGCADIIPGVSGGTMAFILGIYETLLDAIKSVDTDVIKMALKLDIKGIFGHVPWRFLLALLLGIGSAVLLLASLLHDLLENEPTFIFAFFAGLILASIIAIGVKVKWDVQAIASMAFFTVFAFILVGLPVLENANHSPITLFLSGAVAICAMILPGISGSFILLILGQYDYILESVRNMVSERDFSGILPTLLPLGLGITIGIIAFSRILSWLLKHYENVTIAALVGFMLGSLRTIWTEASNGVEVVNPSGSLDGGQIALTIALIVFGFLLVSLLDHMQSRTNPVFAWIWRPGKPRDDIAEKASALE